MGTNEILRQERVTDDALRTFVMVRSLIDQHLRYLPAEDGTNHQIGGEASGISQPKSGVEPSKNLWIASERQHGGKLLGWDLKIGQGPDLGWLEAAIFVEFFLERSEDERILLRFEWKANEREGDHPTRFRWSAWLKPDAHPFDAERLLKAMARLRNRRMAREETRRRLRAGPGPDGNFALLEHEAVCLLHAALNVFATAASPTPPPP